MHKYHRRHNEQEQEWNELIETNQVADLQHTQIIKEKYKRSRTDIRVVVFEWAIKVDKNLNQIKQTICYLFGFNLVRIGAHQVVQTLSPLYIAIVSGYQIADEINKRCNLNKQKVKLAQNISLAARLSLVQRGKD
jgi:hypothetical protein